MKDRGRAARAFNLFGRRNRLFLVLLSSVVALAVADPAFTETGDSEAHTVEFNIPAQSVPAALSEFARQARVQLFFISDGFEDVKANAVIGTYATQHALDLLLAGTGLAASISSESGLKVRPVSASTKSLTLGSQLFAAAETTGGQSAVEKDDLEAQRVERNRASGRSNENRKSGPTIEEIVVTGSNIRGVESVGADVIILDRAYIEMSGIATTTELIQSVPQNFGIGNEAVEAVGVVTNDGRNWGFSSSVNLRGLGTDSTLMLLNGRRSASGGKSGNFVDLNTIPIAAIERVDILSDGASAIYGSDAVGGVVNVILRDDYEGAETSVRYAPGTSDIDEVQFSQIVGKEWGTGNVLFAYEYYDRSALKSADRAYTRNSDLTILGGGNHSIDRSNPGNIDRYTLADGTNLPVSFPIPGRQDGTALTAADLVTGSFNLQNTREGTHVLPKQTRHGVFVSTRQELSQAMELFAEARYSTRAYEFLNPITGWTLAVPSTNAFFVDPFGGSQSLQIRYSEVDDYGPVRSSGDVAAATGVLGATFSLGKSWELEVHGSHGIEETSRRSDRRFNTALLVAALADPDPITAFNPFGDGSFTNPETLAAIEGYSTINVKSQLSTANARLEGDLFDMAGGSAKVAVGTQIRDQSLVSENTFFTSTPEPVRGFAGDIFDLDRDVTAAFAEVYLPFVTEQNRQPGIKKLVVSVAGRYEEYSDFGDTFDPKFGLAWSPADGLTVRGTVGTSFRAPLLEELFTGNNSITLRDRVNPLSLTGRTLALTLAGHSPDLIPQEGTTWTAGVDVAPTSLPGLTFGLTYFETEVDNVIQDPLSIASTVFLDPVTNSPIITFCPCDIELVTMLLNDPQFIDIGTQIPSPNELALSGAIVDGRIQNIAKAELSGLDLNVAYGFESAVGAFYLAVYASHILEFKEQLSNGPLVDKVDTIAKPNSINVRSSLAWNAGGMTASVIARHIGDYTDNLGTPECQVTPCDVSSWTTWDLQLGYEFSNQFSGFLDGIKLSANAKNVFDNDPPFVDVSDAGVGFDAINANPLGRFISLQLTKAW